MDGVVFIYFADVSEYGTETYNRTCGKFWGRLTSVVDMLGNTVQVMLAAGICGVSDYMLRDVGLVGIRLMDQVEAVKTSKALKEIFLEFKDVSHDFIPDERCVWIDLVGLPWHMGSRGSEFVMIRSLLYDGCIKVAWKRFGSDAGEILGVHSQGDCGNVTPLMI
ncbi:hypothetical protein Tco_0558826 [Tanacetum coccineum]